MADVPSALSAISSSGGRLVLLGSLASSMSCLVGAGAFGLACYYSLWTNLPRLKFAGDDEFTLPDFQEASKIRRTQLPLSMVEADGTDSWSVFQNSNLPEWVNSDGILFNSPEEFDRIGTLYFKRKLGLSVWSIGPICLPEQSRPRAGKEDGIVSPELCKKWLDQKPVKSVLYILFGSINTISAAQMSQLAMALEFSGKNFIWVVRPPTGFDINSDFNAEKWLPEGFSERMSESGPRVISTEMGTPGRDFVTSLGLCFSESLRVELCD